jgi:hypothetical protein
MRVRAVLAAVAAVMILMAGALPAQSVDGADDKDLNGVCRSDGAWLGSSPAWGMLWMVVYDSDSNWTGHFTLRFLGGDPTMGGYFPTAVALSNTFGTWVRTGLRTSQYSMVTYGLDAQGQPVYVAKNSGTSELSRGCDLMEVYDSAISFYAPTQDPFGDEPPAYGCMPDPTVSTARRMVADPPCEPPAP